MTRDGNGNSGRGFHYKGEVAYKNWVAILQYAEPVLSAWQGTPQGTPF